MTLPAISNRRALVGLTNTQQLERAVVRVHEVVGRLRAITEFDNPDWKKIDVALADAREFIAGGRLAEIARWLECAGARASKTEIGEILLTLLGAYPNAPRTNLQLYGGLLAIDAASRNPSIFALQLACRRLRETAKFLPAICEVLAAIDAAENELDHHRGAITGFQKQVSAAERALADHDADVAARTVFAQRARRAALPKSAPVGPGSD